MYYTKKGKARGINCFDEQVGNISKNLPKDSDEPLPPNPILEMNAKHKSHKKKGDLEMDPLDKDEKSEKSSKRKKGELENPIEDIGEIHEKTFDISMPGAEPSRDDDYLCTAFSVKSLIGSDKDRVYITGFEANAKADKAHHVIVQKCSDPIEVEGKIW